MAGSFHPVSPDEEIGTEETFARPRRDWEELVLLHRITVDDVARLKGRQWLTAAACAVLFAALVAAQRLLDGGSPGVLLSETIVLGVFAGLAGTVGLYSIYRLQRAIGHRRRRLEVLRETHSPEFRKAWAAPYESPNAARWEHVDLVIPLMCGVALAMGLAEWVLFRF